MMDATNKVFLVVGKLDPYKDDVTRSNSGKVICWKRLPPYPEHVNACKYKKKNQLKNYLNFLLYYFLLLSILTIDNHVMRLIIRTLSG